MPAGKVSKSRHPDEKPEMPIAPMIDCVFLMLVYFMVTSSLERTEADLAYQLPGGARAAAGAEIGPPVVVRLGQDNWPRVEGRRLAGEGQLYWIDLDRFLRHLKESNASFGEPLSLRLQPDEATSHAAVLRALEVVAEVGVEDFRILPTGK